MPVRTAAPPTTFVLRPGVPVLRRDAQTLQVGLDPPLTARLPDRPEVRTLLSALVDGVVADGLSPLAARVLDSLLGVGLVLPEERRPLPGLDAARAQFGTEGARRLVSRAAHGVGIRADAAGHAAAAAQLAAAAVTVDDEAPAVWLVLAVGPVPRESVDPLQRSGVPHLVVDGDAAGRRVGPFVEPGRTACLRCVDAHAAETDPRRPLLVEQAARSGAVPPVDPVLDRLALAWAVRDLCRYLEGDRPSTWSATVEIGPSEAPRATPWLRHPHCGCAWDLLLDLP